MCGFLCVIDNCLLSHLPWRWWWLLRALLFQVKFAASASCESLLEMHNLRPHPRSTESESALLPKLQVNHLCVNIWEALVFKGPTSWEPSFIPPWYMVQFSSVQSLSHVHLSVAHGLQHTRPPCPSPATGVHSDSCPLSRWCYPMPGSSPGWTQGFPREDSVGERIVKGERQRLELTGLRRKPVKPVTSGLHWPRRPQAPSQIAESAPP